MKSVTTVVLVDRTCAFCSSWEKTIISLAGKSNITFDSLDSISNYCSNPDDRARAVTSNSVVVIDGGKLLTRFKAIRTILYRCGGPARIASLLLWLVPRPLGDLGYKFIAANRHRIPNRQ